LQYSEKLSVQQGFSSLSLKFHNAYGHGFDQLIVEVDCEGAFIKDPEQNVCCNSLEHGKYIPFIAIFILPKVSPGALCKVGFSE
jgi:hypothetical protein